MISEGDLKDFFDIFYTNINNCRSQGGLDILSEDVCLPNDLLESLLKGGSKESEDRTLLYKKCQLFCSENDFQLFKQELYLPPQSQLDAAVSYMFNQIFLDHEHDIRRNVRLTHAKIYISKVQNDLLRSCLCFSAKPLQVYEFSFDTFTESYLIYGKLNKDISSTLNVYALKIIDHSQMKSVIIGPGRGEINDKMIFTFRIPSSMLKEEGIMPSNNRCDVEFFHKIDAEYYHFRNSDYNTVEIDHQFTLIMRQVFHPVHQGKTGVRKGRRDSPDIRRSGSLFKNRLSSSCNKENRIPNSNSQTYPAASLSASKNPASIIKNPFSYKSENKSKRMKGGMEEIREGGEGEFSIYKDDIFRSQQRNEYFLSEGITSNKNKVLFSFGERDEFFEKPQDTNKENELFERNNIIQSQKVINPLNTQNRSFQIDKQGQNNMMVTSLLNNSSSIFKQPDNNSFKVTQKDQSNIFKAPENLFAQSQHTNLFSNQNNSNIFANPLVNLFNTSNQTIPNNSSKIFATPSNNNTNSNTNNNINNNINNNNNPSIPKNIFTNPACNIINSNNNSISPQNIFTTSQTNLFNNQTSLQLNPIAIAPTPQIPLDVFSNSNKGNSASIQSNPFVNSQQFYRKGVKHTFTVYQNLATQQLKSHSTKERQQKALLDSRGFKESSQCSSKLKEIEKGYKWCRELLKSDYHKYWNTGEHCDFTIQLDMDTEAYFKLHKVVVGHYSEYFRKIFSDSPSIQHFKLKQNNFNSEAVRLMFKWMYFNELPAHEWEEMSFKQAQQALNCALYTKTWDFLTQIIMKVIISKMSSEKVIDFLILSEFLPSYFEQQKDCDQKQMLLSIFKLLQNYCILYFSNNSLEVIEKTDSLKIQQLIEINSDLLFTLVNETSLKFDTLDHLEKLFTWLCKQAPMYFGRNIIELCSFFESQYIFIQPFDSIYMPFEKEIKPLNPSNAFTTPYLDTSNNLMKDTPLKKKDDVCEDIEIQITSDEDIVLSKKEWPSIQHLKRSSSEEQAKSRDCLFQRNHDFIFQLKRPDLPTVFITEEFSSFSSKWRLILQIDHLQDQNISVFLRECGQRNPKEQDTTLYNERVLYSSVMFRIEFQERRSASFDMFYSFATNQNTTVGKVNFCSAKAIADPQTHSIKVKVWIEELNYHSALMHFLSQKITDFMVEGFNEEQKKVAESQVEQSNKKRMVNNEPVSNNRQSIRVMDALLDKEWYKITAQMDEEGKIVSPIKSRMSLNRETKERLKTSSKNKELNLFSMPVFDAYYLLSSNNLNITHEKYALHLLYRLTLNKSDLEIDLLLHGIRYSYLDLEQMLNLARDHTAVKRNKYFQMMVRKELHQRFEMYQDKVVPLQKGRNHYDYAQFYQNQNNRKDFKENFLDWLFNSEHHPGFKREIQLIQNSIRQQMDELKQKEAELALQFQNLQQAKLGARINQPIPPYYLPNQPTNSSVSTNPSTNSQGSFPIYNNSYEQGNIQKNKNNIPTFFPTQDSKFQYNGSVQPSSLNPLNQERVKIRNPPYNYNQSKENQISSNKTVAESDNCNIF